MSSASPLSEDDRRRAITIGVAALEAFYGSRGADLEGDAEFLRGFFDRLLARSGFSRLAVTSRAKELQHALEKMRRKCVDEDSNYSERILAGESPERIISDLVAVRITCRFSDQIDQIASLVRNNCQLRENESIDFRKPKDYGNFGYAALHLIAEPFKATPTRFYYSECAFEVQVRSALMDIWGVVNWDVAYTDEAKLPYGLLRRMSVLSALFYLVDEEFIRIRNEVSKVDLAAPLSVTSGTTHLIFCERVHIALSNRGIDLEQSELLCVAKCLEKAANYTSKSDVVRDNTTLDALALYLFDRDRFMWLMNSEIVKALDDLDRNDSGALSC